MAEIATWLPMAMNIGSSILGKMGADQSAEGANQAADAAIVMGQRQRVAAQFKAQQLRSQALQTVAASQRAGDTEEHQARILQSRALAVAAASGGGVNDPTIMNIIAGIAGEGSYRRAIRLYQGEDQARTLRMQASAADYEGALAEEAGRNQAKGYETQAESYELQGTSALLKGAGSLFKKYAGGGAGMPSVGASGDSNLIGGFDFIDFPVMG